MSPQTEVSPLIRTRLHCLRTAGDLTERTRLLEHLNARRDRPLTLVPAPAGYGKTTLLAQWLDQAPYQAAWLQHAPPPLHPVTACRKDPSFSISHLRASLAMIEIRMNDLSNMVIAVIRQVGPILAAGELGKRM